MTIRLVLAAVVIGAAMVLSSCGGWRRIEQQLGASVRTTGTRWSWDQGNWG